MGVADLIKERGIKVKNLTIPEMEKRREIPFDPRKDITDVEKRMLEDEFKKNPEYETSIYIPAILRLTDIDGAKLRVEEKKWMNFVETFFGYEDPKAKSIETFISVWIAKTAFPDSKLKFSTVSERLINLTDSQIKKFGLNTFDVTRFLAARKLICGDNPYENDPEVIETINLVSSIRQSNLAEDYFHHFAALRIAFPKLFIRTPGDQIKFWEYGKKQLKRIATSSLEPNPWAEFAKLAFDMSIVAADEVKPNGKGGLEIILPSSGHALSTPSEMPKVRRFG